MGVKLTISKAGWAELVRLYCLDKGWPDPVLEHRFAPPRRWRFDLSWPALLVAVEIHGGVYSGGHHTRGKGFEDDREKINEAICRGWKVIEVSTGQVKSGQLYGWLERLLM